jgi:hypothetical protein
MAPDIRVSYCSIIKTPQQLLSDNKKSKTPFEALLYRGKRVIALCLDGVNKIAP